MRLRMDSHSNQDDLNPILGCQRERRYFQLIRAHVSNWIRAIRSLSTEIQQRGVWRSYKALRIYWRIGGWAEIRYQAWRLSRALPRPALNPMGSDIYRSLRMYSDGSTRPERIAVIVHLHYPTLWPEIKSYLDNIPVPFDLYVTLTSTLGIQAESEIRQAFPAACLEIVPNRGRDILPFHRLMGRVLDTGRYDLVCKIHSKKSSRWELGEQWRRDLLDGVLGDPARILEIILEFRRRSDLGMVAAFTCMASASRNGEEVNGARLEQLVHSMKLPWSSADFIFVAGTMFWCRTQALHPLRSRGFHETDFEEESQQIDGTLAHAYERLFGWLVQYNGYICASTRTHRIVPFSLSPAHRHLRLV